MGPQQLAWQHHPHHAKQTRQNLQEPTDWPRSQTEQRFGMQQAVWQPWGRKGKVD